MSSRMLSLIILAPQLMFTLVKSVKVGRYERRCVTGWYQCSCVESISLRSSRRLSLIIVALQLVFTPGKLVKVGRYERRCVTTKLVYGFLNVFSRFFSLTIFTSIFGNICLKTF